MARTVADFVAIQDHGSTLPHPQTGRREVQFAFGAPDVWGAPAMLAFRLESTGEVVLRAQLNGSLLFEQPLRTTPVRSFHELVSTRIVRPSGNELTMAVSGQGSVTVSDLVLHFQAWLSTPPTPLVAAQNTRYSQPLSCGARAGVIVISGRYFLQIGAPGTPDLPAFVEKDVAAVAAQLQVYRAAHPEIGRDTTEILMMDVEDPHPKKLHAQSPAEQEDIVRAYTRRIAALRQTFPNARLCMYGTLNPDGRGRPDAPGYLARLAALQKAGDDGLYDELDYLVPVLYPRFGPNDPPASWRSYRAYTEQGIDGSRQLRRSNRTSLPVLPVTGFRIANDDEHTEHNDQLLLDLPTSDPLRPTLGVQLEVMAEKGVQQVVFWAGKDSDLIDDPNPNARTVTQHVCGR
jgi:hypothetical protein